MSMRTFTRPLPCAAAVVGGAGALIGAVIASTTPTATAAVTPKIGHIFVITLENEGYVATFGNPSADP
jgi:hypothetical protein